MLPPYDEYFADSDYIGKEPEIYLDILMPIKGGEFESNAWIRAYGLMSKGRSGGETWHCCGIVNRKRDQKL